MDFAIRRSSRFQKSETKKYYSYIF